jgi:hypothetical protein
MKKTISLFTAALLTALQLVAAQTLHVVAVGADGTKNIPVSDTQDILVGDNGTMTVNKTTGSPVTGITEITFAMLTVGIENTEITSAVFVYPNPVREYVTVSGVEPNVGINLFDMNGKLLQTVVSKGDAVRIDVSPYPPGVYLLQAGKSVIKFTKQQN